MQGHILAAQAIGDIYYCGKGVAKDYERAIAAYMVAAEAGNAMSQHQLSYMYREGIGVAVDHQQARAWLEKAAAQDYPLAFGLRATVPFTTIGLPVRVTVTSIGVGSERFGKNDAHDFKDGIEI